MGDENPHSINSPGHTRGLAPSDCEEAETIADSLEALFHPVNDPLVPAFNEVVNEASEPTRLIPQMRLSEPKTGRFKTPYGVSNSAKHHVQMMYRIGL